MELIVIGEIINVRGIRGELKVRPITSDASRFSKLKVVYINNKCYKLLRAYNENKFVYIALADVADRDTAEKLKGSFISIDKVLSLPLEENEYLISDMLGIEVFGDDGTVIGSITDVAQYGAADVITVENNGKVIRFPFLNRLIKSLDIAKKEFITFKNLFDEVAVYED